MINFIEIIGLGLCTMGIVAYVYYQIQVGTDKYTNPIYRVIISGAKNIGKANLIEKKLRDIGFKNAFVIAL